MEDITLQKLRVGIRQKHTFTKVREEIRKEETEERLGKYARQAQEARYFKVGLTTGNHRKAGMV